MTNCFRCGDEDHLSYDCPSNTRYQATPPERAQEGAPIPEAGPLSGHCPLCYAPPGKPCRNLASDKPMYRDGRPLTHPARHEPAWHDPHTAHRRAQIASGIGYTGQPSEPAPYLNEPADLAGLGLGRLVEELRKTRAKEEAEWPDRSPEREAASRELAARQLAELRSTRRVLR